MLAQLPLSFLITLGLTVRPQNSKATTTNLLHLLKSAESDSLALCCDLLSIAHTVEPLMHECICVHRNAWLISVKKDLRLSSSSLRGAVTLLRLKNFSPRRFFWCRRWLLRLHYEVSRRPDWFEASHPLKMLPSNLSNLVLTSGHCRRLQVCSLSCIYVFLNLDQFPSHLKLNSLKLVEVKNLFRCIRCLFQLLLHTLVC
jgi:hypothetical protein